MVKLHSHYLIVIVKFHTLNAHGITSKASDIRFKETYAHTLLGNKENVGIFIGLLYFYKFVIITKVDRDETVLSYIGEIHYGSLLYDTFSCNHEKILAFLKFLDRNNGRDFFLRLKL